MTNLPRIGTMIRCVGASVEAGAVTYNGHLTIDLPHRAITGKIIPGTRDFYGLKVVGMEWVYKFVREA